MPGLWLLHSIDRTLIKLLFDERWLTWRQYCVVPTQYLLYTDVPLFILN